MADRQVKITILGDAKGGIAALKSTESAAGGLEAKITGLGGKLSSFGSVVGTALGGLAIVGVGAVAALGASSISAASDFESAMSSVAAVAGASDAELKSLSDTAIKLGQDTTLSGIGATEAAQAMRELAAAGMSTADIIGGGALGALRLASAGGLEVGRAAEIAALALAQFGLAGSEAANVADLFAAAANSSAISVEDIAESMKYVGPVANSMGLSIEETTAAIAALGNQGIKGSAAGTALRSMIVSLASPSKEASKVIKDLGLEMFDASGKMKSIAGVSQQLKTKMAGLTDQQRASALATLFGNEALSAATILYGEGGDGIDKWVDDLENGATAAEVGAKRNNNLKGSIESLKGAFETAQIVLGRAFLPALKDLADRAAVAVAAAIPLIEAWGPRLVAGITSAIGVITRFGGYVASAVGAIIGAWQKLRDGEITMAQFIGGVKNLIAVVLGDIGGLLGKVGTFLAPYFAAIGSAITAALPIVATEIGKLASAFGSWIQTTAIPYLATNLPLWRDAIITFVSGTAIPAITTAVGSLASAFGGWIQGTAIPYLTTNLPLWKDAIVAFVTGPAAEAVRGAVISLATAFSGWVTGTAIPFLQANLGIWLGAFLIWVSGTALPAITEGVKGLAAGLVSWIKGEDIASKFAPWLVAVTQAFADGLALVAEFIKIAGPRLIEWINDKETQAAFGELLKTVGKGLADIADATFDWQNEQVGKLVAYLAENSGLWLGYFVQNNIDFVKWLAEKSRALDQWQKEAIDSLARFGAQLVVETGKAWGESFAAMADWTGQMVVLATELPGKILSGIGDLATTLYQKGVDLVQGLINGINSKIGELISTAGRLASAVANPIGTFFDMRSPSRLAMEWGHNIGDGLIIGLDESVDPVTEMANRLARGIEAAFTGGVPGGSDVVGMATRMAQGIGAAFAGGGGGGSVGYNAAGDLDRFEINKTTETAQERIKRWTGDNVRDYGMDAENARFAALARLKRDYERTNEDWRRSGFDLSNIAAMDTEAPVAGRNYGPGSGPQGAVWKNTGTDRWELAGGGGAGAGWGATNIYIQAPVYGVDHMEDVVVAALESSGRRGR